MNRRGRLSPRASAAHTCAQEANTCAWTAHAGPCRCFVPWTSGERLSLDDWIALPEDNSQHVELVEEVLQVSPKPVFGHQRAAARLWGQLNDQLPPEFEPVMYMDVVIAGGPVATVRVPDVL